jgi:hypothetical protein
MKLEKCALCGAEPETSIIHGRDDTWCGTRRCAMQVCETKGKWNSLQRAIRKATPVGRVLSGKKWWCERCDMLVDREHNHFRSRVYPAEVRVRGGGV